MKMNPAIERLLSSGNGSFQISYISTDIFLPQVRTVEAPLSSPKHVSPVWVPLIMESLSKKEK